MRRRDLLLGPPASILAGILAGLALPTWAGAPEHYEPQSFKAALASGRPLVVHVYAGWCPVCRVQKPLLEQLAKDKAFEGTEFVAVDFDKDREFLRTYRVANQSIILVFKDGQEKARLIGITDADKIRSGLLGAIRGDPGRQPQ